MSLAERIIAPTPKFHKRNRNIAGIAALVASCVLAVSSAGVALPIAIVTGAKAVIAVGGIIAGYAQTTVE